TEGEAAFRSSPLPGRRAVVPPEDLVVGVDGKPGRGDLEALVDRLDGQDGVGLLPELAVAAEEFEEAVGLRTVIAEDEGIGAFAPVPCELLAEAADVAVEGGLRTSYERQRFFGLTGEGAEEQL